MWRLVPMVFLALVTAVSSSAVGSEPVWSAASAQGMTFRWRIEGNQLHGTISAPASGWVAVGFNDRPRLDGSRLVMGAVSGGQVRLEEHLADPPSHHSRLSVQGRSRVVLVRGVEQDGTTRIAFRLPLSSEGFGPDLVAGSRIHLALAWSHDDDFGHHSAMRTSTDIDL